MKKVLLTALLAVVMVFGASAQVQVASPHPDLNIKVTRCAASSGVVVVDMVITNYGAEEVVISDSNNMLAYDDEGNVYTSKNSKMLSGLVSVGLSTGPKFTMPQDIPLKYRVQIEGVAGAATKLVLLKIPFLTRGGNMQLNAQKPIQIKNLEWVE